MKTKLKNKRAFTLIELLIVIAIIGVLFIVLVSKVDFATDKAKATGVQTDFRSFQVAFDQVAKENAGFNIFGWDTGDVNGDHIRNSYDRGDTNQNGIEDTGETFIGRKEYGENWTTIYTMLNPKVGMENDDSAFVALEAAINANLDPKLHITITPDVEGGVLTGDATITMANQARDPWKNEYHGVFITNAVRDNGADRGAIILYSNGANGKWGSAHDITDGVVAITVPGNNVAGQDDMSIVSCYTYVNGYGEVLGMSTGFSNNQSFKGNVSNAPAIVPGNGGNASGNGGGSGLSLPTPKLDGTITDAVSPFTYSWSELKALAQANLSANVLRDTYGIEVGDYKEVNGVKYVLVDLDGNEYDGFVFMYNANKTTIMSSDETNTGGYGAYGMRKVNAFYSSLDAELQSSIKSVNITYNEGKFEYNTTPYHITTEPVALFLASYKEVGLAPDSTDTYFDGYNAEGEAFDLFNQSAESRKAFMDTINMTSNWWLRSAYSSVAYYFRCVDRDGYAWTKDVAEVCYLVPAFVIG